MAMTEVERELEVENRRAIRTAKLQQFNLEQRIRQKKKKEKEAAKAKKAGGRRKSTRAQSKKTLSRKAALDNLLAKKKRSNRSRMSDSSEDEMDISSASDDDDEDYEYGGTLKKTGASKKKKTQAKRKEPKSASKEDAMEVDEEEDVKQREEERQPRIDLVDIIGEVGNKHVEDTFGVDKRKKTLTNSIAQLTRQDIYDDIHQPWFKAAAKDMFVRVQKPGGRRGEYLLMRIKKVYSGKNPYTITHRNGLGTRKTSEMFELRVHAEDNKRIYCRAHPNISDKPCTEDEFSSFLKRLTNDKYPVPRKNEVRRVVDRYRRMKKESQENMEDIKKMIALNNKYRKKAINISTSKIEVKRKLAVLEESEIPEDEEAMKEREEQIEKLKEKYADLVRQERGRRRGEAQGSTHGKNQREKSIRQHFKDGQCEIPSPAASGSRGDKSFHEASNKTKILWDMAGNEEEEKRGKVKEDKPQKEDKEKKRRRRKF